MHTAVKMAKINHKEPIKNSVLAMLFPKRYNSKLCFSLKLLKHICSIVHFSRALMYYINSVAITYLKEKQFKIIKKQHFVFIFAC